MRSDSQIYLRMGKSGFVYVNIALKNDYKWFEMIINGLKWMEVVQNV